MECWRCISHLLSLLLNLQYDENMNYDFTLILEKDLKAHSIAMRERERRNGMENGVFDASDDLKLES